MLFQISLRNYYFLPICANIILYNPLFWYISRIISETPPANEECWLSVILFKRYSFIGRETGCITTPPCIWYYSLLQRYKDILIWQVLFAESIICNAFIYHHTIISEMNIMLEVVNFPMLDFTSKLYYIITALRYRTKK